MDPAHLKLTDFVDLQTLQEIQDNFAAIAGVRATIADADGTVLTQARPTREFLRRQQALAVAEAEQAARPTFPQKEGAEYVAPIVVNDQQLGTLRMTIRPNTVAADDGRLDGLARKYELDVKRVRSLANQLARTDDRRPAAIQFLYLLANAIARLCYQEYLLRRQLDDLTVVSNVTMTLAEARDLPAVLQTTVKLVCELMDTKAASIRLIDRAHDELTIMAGHNLSRSYLNKGPIRLSRAGIDAIALGPAGHEYVRDMTTDPRVQYPHEAAAEGIASMLSVGMQYKGQRVGVLRVYTACEQAFSPIKIDLLKAVASQAAAAIENARLAQEGREAEALEKQVQMAAVVQQRMIPRTPPSINGLDLAAVYVPCFELGGDFYDFIPFPSDNVGMVVADVSGKGVPASLIMASVRAALRAQVDNIYYLYEVVRRVNGMLCRDTTGSEFVTLFYGVLDAGNKRFTYCNAGHPPAMVLRRGDVFELTADNMLLGVEEDEQFVQKVVQLESGDVLLLYTDGLPDAANFQGERFGRQRIIDTLKHGGPSADTIAQHVLWETRKFVGMAKRTDDITMIVARVL